MCGCSAFREAGRSRVERANWRMLGAGLVRAAWQALDVCAAGGAI